MRTTRLSWSLAVMALVLAAACERPIRMQPAPGSAASAERPTAPEELARTWDAEHVSPSLPPLLRHEGVESGIRAVVQGAPELFSTEVVGRSVEGRSINHVWFGSGPFHVLMWSQMHGDEPTATSALFDVYEFIGRHREEPRVQRILRALTVHTVPMLNPDGAERFQRRNAQGIDVNRDALLLQSPEGRALKALRDRLNPPIGFNLHNQNWRTSAGTTGKPASISLLAVAFDPERRDNEGRVRAKKMCSLIAGALDRLAPGQLARYDDAFEVRAFGDNLTRWGTSVVLIETGAWPEEPPDPPLVRLNFVALVTALEALATGSVDRETPARYESLPMNESAVFYRLISGATIVPGTGVPPFLGDIGITASRAVRQGGDGEPRLRLTTRIEDLGDLRVFSALETIDGTGLVVAPLLDPAVKPGDEVVIPDSSAKLASSIAVGQPAALMLLRSLGSDGRYRVERVLEAGETR